MNATSADGTTVALHPTGQGPDMLLIHGSAADHRDWSFVAPLFERTHRVVAMARRGRGDSGDHAVHTLEREAGDVVAAASALRDPIVFAHSFGALVALEAARLGAPIRKLVLYEPPFFAEPMPGELADALDKLAAAGERDRALHTFLREAADMPEDEVAMLRADAAAWQAGVETAHTLGRELRACYAFRLDAARYKHVRVPTLLLLGTESPPFFGEAIHALKAALPDSRIELLKGQSHAAMMAAPDLLADVVRPFVA